MRNLFKDDETIKVIGESATAHEAAARIPVLRPDVAVLEVRLPDGSGIDLCRRLRAADPTIKVLMLTGYDDEVLLDAISAGAAGYLSKSIVGTELLAAMHAVVRGEPVLDPAFLPPFLQSGQDEVEDDGLSSLTARERRILTLLADGFTNREIGDQVAQVLFGRVDFQLEARFVGLRAKILRGFARDGSNVRLGNFDRDLP